MGWQIIYTAPKAEGAGGDADEVKEDAVVLPFPAIRPSSPARKPVSVRVRLDAHAEPDDDED